MFGGEEDEEDVCPLCMEPLDLTDKNFIPCHCGYQVCLWCWHHIKDNINGLCPACRTPYEDEPCAVSDIDREELIRKSKKGRGKDKSERKKGKDTSRNGVLSPGLRRNLSNVRVIQRNLVYVIGLPPATAKEEVLRRFEYFGQYGKILKIAINRSHINISGSNGSASAYVTFAKKEDAASVILAVDGFTLEGRCLRASFGTTKYCNAFLRNVPCNNPDCLYLHELGDDSDSFTKEQLHAGKNVPNLKDISGSIALNSVQHSAKQTVLPPVPVVAGSLGAAAGASANEAAGSNTQQRATASSYVDIAKPTTSPNRSVAHGVQTGQNRSAVTANSQGHPHRRGSVPNGMYVMSGSAAPQAMQYQRKQNGMPMNGHVPLSSDVEGRGSSVGGRAGIKRDVQNKRGLGRGGPVRGVLEVQSVYVKKVAGSSSLSAAGAIGSCSDVSVSSTSSNGVGDSSDMSAGILNGQRDRGVGDTKDVEGSGALEGPAEAGNSYDRVMEDGVKMEVGKGGGLLPTPGDPCDENKVGGKEEDSETRQMVLPRMKALAVETEVLSDLQVSQLREIGVVSPVRTENDSLLGSHVEPADRPNNAPMESVLGLPFQRQEVPGLDSSKGMVAPTWQNFLPPPVSHGPSMMNNLFLPPPAFGAVNMHASMSGQIGRSGDSLYEHSQVPSSLSSQESDNAHLHEPRINSGYPDTTVLPNGMPGSGLFSEGNVEGMQAPGQLQEADREIMDPRPGQNGMGHLDGLPIPPLPLYPGFGSLPRPPYASVGPQSLLHPQLSPPAGGGIGGGNGGSKLRDLDEEVVGVLNEPTESLAQLLGIQVAGKLSQASRRPRPSMSRFAFANEEGEAMADRERDDPTRAGERGIDWQNLGPPSGAPLCVSSAHRHTETATDSNIKVSLANSSSNAGALREESGRGAEGHSTGAGVDLALSVVERQSSAGHGGRAPKKDTIHHPSSENSGDEMFEQGKPGSVTTDLAWLQSVLPNVRISCGEQSNWNHREEEQPTVEPAPQSSAVSAPPSSANPGYSITDEASDCQSTSGITKEPHRNVQMQKTGKSDSSQSTTVSHERKAAARETRAREAKVPKPVQPPVQTQRKIGYAQIVSDGEDRGSRDRRSHTMNKNRHTQGMTPLGHAGKATGNVNGSPFPGRSNRGSVGILGAGPPSVGGMHVRPRPTSVVARAQLAATAPHPPTSRMMAGSSPPTRTYVASISSAGRRPPTPISAAPNTVSLSASRSANSQIQASGSQKASGIDQRGPASSRAKWALDPAIVGQGSMVNEETGRSRIGMQRLDFNGKSVSSSRRDSSSIATSSNNSTGYGSRKGLQSAYGGHGGNGTSNTGNRVASSAAAPFLSVS